MTKQVTFAKTPLALALLLALCSIAQAEPVILEDKTYDEDTTINSFAGLIYSQDFDQYQKIKVAEGKTLTVNSRIDETSESPSQSRIISAGRGTIEFSGGKFVFTKNDYYAQKPGTSAPDLQSFILATTNHPDPKPQKIIFNNQGTKFTGATPYGALLQGQLTLSFLNGPMEMTLDRSGSVSSRTVQGISLEESVSLDIQTNAKISIIAGANDTTATGIRFSKDCNGEFRGEKINIDIDGNGSQALTAQYGLYTTTPQSGVKTITSADEMWIDLHGGNKAKTLATAVEANRSMSFKHINAKVSDAKRTSGLWVNGYTTEISVEREFTYKGKSSASS